MIIEANRIAVDDSDSELIVIGFDSSNSDPAGYLILQRSYHFDDQDAALGMNDVYIERNSQARSAYGGITHCDLKRNQLLINLDSSTARELGGDATYEIRFSLDDQAFEELRSGLTRLFDGLATTLTL